MLLGLKQPCQISILSHWELNTCNYSIPNSILSWAGWLLSFWAVSGDVTPSHRQTDRGSRSWWFQRISYFPENSITLTCMRQTCFPCGSLQKHPCWLQSFSPVQKSHTIFVSCCFSCSQKGNFLCATADKPQSTFPKLKSKTRTFDLTLSLHYSRLCIDQQTEPLDAWIMFVPREIGQSRDQQLRRDTAVR